MKWPAFCVPFCITLAVLGHETMASDAALVNITGNDNVVSVGQIGGITAREVTIIEQALRPEFRILERTDEDLPNGSHVVRLLGDVQSPITPGLLVVQIETQGLKDVQVMPPPVGGVSTMMMRNVRRGGNSFYAEIPSPRGQYMISIFTQTSSDIKLGVSF